MTGEPAMNDPGPDRSLRGRLAGAIGGAWFGPGVLAGLFVVVLGGLLWVNQAKSLAVNRADLAACAGTAKEIIHQRLDAGRDYLLMLADDMARDAVTEEVFRERLARYMADHAELVSVVYVDAGGIARWAAPAPVGPKTIGLPLACPQSKQGHIAAARTGRCVYSAAHISLQGEPAFDLNVPIRRDDGFGGTLVGVYSCQRILRLLHREIIQKHKVSLVDRDGNVILPLPSAAHVDERLTAVAAVDPPGQGLSLRLDRYGKAFWGLGTSLLTLLYVGLVVGMSWGMWSLKRQIARRTRAEASLRETRDQLAQRVRERTADLERANRMLQQEMVERQRAEEGARQRQEELAHVARVSTMGEMAAGLAHELNQPLGAIASFAEGGIRLIESGQDRPEALHAALTEVSGQADRAGRIIHRLRSFVAKGEPQKAPCALRRLAEEVTDLVAMDIRQEQIDFRLDVPETLPTILADGIQVQQVLLNLIRNAVEALQQVGPEGRTLTVSAGVDGDGFVRVAVADTGRGCDAGELARICEAFYTTKQGGIGMGLSISRSIVQAHGGRLWAGPNRPRGLVVSFTIPTAAAAEKETPHDG